MWSILSTAGRIDEQGFFERIYRLFPGLQAPDEELVRACLAAYVAPGELGSLGTDDDAAARTDDHARVIATLVDYAHRLGLRAWVAAREHDRPSTGGRWSTASPTRSGGSTSRSSSARRATRSERWT